MTATKQNVSNRGRSATPSNSTAPKTVNRGRAATVSSTKPVVAARAGVKQNVVGNGTKITSATKSNLVSESCTEKYNGCIDSFCMIENEVGGRCNCDNKIFELDKILAEIEEIDLQSYRLATTGAKKPQNAKQSSFNSPGN